MSRLRIKGPPAWGHLFLRHSFAEYINSVWESTHSAFLGIERGLVGGHKVYGDYDFKTKYHSKVSLPINSIFEGFVRDANAGNIELWRIQGTSARFSLLHVTDSSHRLNLRKGHTYGAGTLVAYSGGVPGKDGVAYLNANGGSTVEHLCVVVDQQAHKILSGVASGRIVQGTGSYEKHQGIARVYSNHMSMTEWKWVPEIIREMKKLHMSMAFLPLMVSTMIQESSGNAKEPGGGLMQLEPSTFAQYGKGNIWNPRDNIDASIRYMKSLEAQARPHSKNLHDLYWHMALGYNSGGVNNTWDAKYANQVTGRAIALTKKTGGGGISIPFHWPSAVSGFVGSLAQLPGMGIIFGAGKAVGSALQTPQAIEDVAKSLGNIGSGFQDIGTFLSDPIGSLGKWFQKGGWKVILGIGALVVFIGAGSRLFTGQSATQNMMKFSMPTMPQGSAPQYPNLAGSGKVPEGGVLGRSGYPEFGKVATGLGESGATLKIPAIPVE